MATERKVFVPLENNPTVMTSLAHTLGLSPSLSFHDIYTLDPELVSQGLIPRPVHALLFIYPLTPANETAYDAEELTLPTYTASGASEPVLWYNQTIRNACGLIGILHCLTNGTVAAEHLVPGSALTKLIDQATPLGPVDRAQLLYDSPLLEAVHAQHASQGDTVPPADPANWHDDQGFLAFVRGKDGHLWELEGRRKGPVDRGLIPEGEDMLGQSVIERSVGAFMKREKDTGNGDMRFSLLGLSNTE